MPWLVSIFLSLCPKLKKVTEHAWWSTKSGQGCGPLYQRSFQGELRVLPLANPHGNQATKLDIHLVGLFWARMSNDLPLHLWVCLCCRQMDYRKRGKKVFARIYVSNLLPSRLEIAEDVRWLVSSMKSTHVIRFPPCPSPPFPSSSVSPCLPTSCTFQCHHFLFIRQEKKVHKRDGRR